ncbi:MAG TPA: phosphatase PAP2 family protein [Mycobacteriales bacterium]|nr:phosphatase PAP2 family protein [Mycobacteriales bacterium]
MTARTSPELTRADRRLTLRLALGLVAMAALGLGFLLLALLVRANWDPLIDLDQAVADRLHGFAVEHGWFVTLLKLLSNVFDPITFRVVTTVAALVLLWRRHFRLGIWTLVTVWGAALLGLVLKVLVDRTRPDLVDAVATAPGRSFPSGHALTSTVGCAVLLLLVMPLLRGGWRALAVGVAVAVPLAVGFARIGLGVHFLSDVLAGELLGLVWVATMAWTFRAWRRDVGLPEGPKTEAEPELSEERPG